jgi:DNA-binding transcriptional LysR family regulator
MLDLDLVRSFVAIVDAGSFTRAAERIHRTQSTVSQQLRKLEQDVGRPLLLRERAGGGIALTEAGEVLLGYARRLISISAEAREAVQRPALLGTVRLGVPEDFAGKRLTDLLSGFARAAPQIRLDTVSGLSADLLRLLEATEIDLALVTRDQGAGPCLAYWPERTVWVAGRSADLATDPVPLAVFSQGCVYRRRTIDALEAAGRRWRIAYASQGLIGVQAAISSGLGIGLLSEESVLPDHRRLGPDEGFAEPPPSEQALVARAGRLDAGQRRLADYLIASL